MVKVVGLSVHVVCLLLGKVDPKDTLTDKWPEKVGCERDKTEGRVGQYRDQGEVEVFVGVDVEHEDGNEPEGPSDYELNDVDSTSEL